jgi:predicted MPP superfamily phosphohydrolase
MKKIWNFIKILLKLLLLLLVLAAAMAAVFRYLQKRTHTLDFVESYYQIQSDKLTDNVRVILLSDLHLREFGEKNVDLVTRIEALHPDIIAITGDMNIRSNEDYHVVIELCEQLVDIVPVYYVAGNHEWSVMINEGSEIGNDVMATGVHMINDKEETIEVNGNTIKIGGLAEAPAQYAKYGKEFFDYFQEGDMFKLLLVHYPEYFSGEIEDADLTGANIDVALCGHAHGGQVRIPGIGGLFTKDQGWFPKLTEGVHEIEDISVVISRGLGDSSDVPRINNDPELVIVDMNWY